MNFIWFSVIPVGHGNVPVMIPSHDSMMIPAAFESSRNLGILWNLALRHTLNKGAHGGAYSTPQKNGALSKPSVQWWLSLYANSSMGQRDLSKPSVVKLWQSRKLYKAKLWVAQVISHAAVAGHGAGRDVGGFSAFVHRF